ncbi:uncharacterized protein LOC111698786 [Eurytemora carolleeae]|uniref:uncharacterized protein LOC111698786 n=1 Tax=Eurytemora carolleeae TaxID=1294199 RepID=UPI000C76BDE1|nr:uncharacterized protein LOC111698786 [Eurytemora carolleeae]|eukprot:XP_023324985.1 uncharacterized protein LOC111698786 [Eurytemora affinis]
MDYTLYISRSRSRSRSMNTSGAWSSLDNGLALSSPDTLSLTLSDMDSEARMSSPDHLVNRKTILDRIGGLQEISGHSRHHNSSRSCGSESDFYLNWSVERGQPRRQGSVPWSGSSGSQYNGAGTGSGIWNPGTGNGTWNGRNWNGTLDRMSMSSGESQSSGSNYDQPKTVLKVTTSPQVLKRLPSSRGFIRPLSPSMSSASSLSPPLTPKSLRRVLQQQGGEGDHLRRQIAAAPCSCGSAAPREVPGFENYDVPRNLGNQDALQFYDTPRNIKEALGSSHQSQKDGMGNYDIPGDPLPVFTKPCGCLMRLTTSNTGEVRVVTSTPAEVMLMTQGEGEGRRSNNSTLDRDMTWTCAREGSTGECSELKIPRVKLTGQGRMPVVDMSKINAIRCLSEPPSEKDQAPAAGRSLSPNIISGLPPRHGGGPVYAQIDRSKKICQGCNQKIQHRCNKQVGRGAPPPPDHANYTNMDFAQSLSLYENSRDVLSRLEKLPQSLTRDQVETENYLPMYSSSNPDYELMRAPENSENAKYHEMAPISAGDRSSLCSDDRSSLYSSNYDIVDSMALMSDTRFDTIKHAPKNFIKIDDETFMYKPEKEISLPDNAGTGISLQEQSLDQLAISLQGTNLFSGYVTIPRSKVSDSIHNLSKSQSPVLTMRRSASVPCKRDSTSSGGSDSGVSTGSPRQSTLDQLDSIDQTSGGSSPQSEMQTEVN